MKLNRSHRANPELFTGTMADVSFLLVIFFVVTAVFSVTRGLDFNPEIEKGPIEVEPRHSIDIRVLADGRLKVDGQPMALRDLLEYVGAHLKDNPTKPVILRSDRNATYGSMITVLDELRSAPDRAGFEIRTLAIPTYREMGRDWTRVGADPLDG